MITSLKSNIFLAMLIGSLLCSILADGQRMGHRASRSSFGSRGNPGSINGGSVRSADRPANYNPSNQNRSTSRPSTADVTGPAKNTGGNKAGSSKPSKDIDKGRNAVSTQPSRDVSDRGNANVSGNDVNINVDRSKDINIANNRNTVVRKTNVAAYHRPPYAYGGRMFYAHHPYYYHPYHPYYYGPAWNPWGVFVAALAVTAIVIAIDNQNYHYDQGVWYTESNDGYVVVQAPVGGTVTTIPQGSETVVVNNVTNYYYGGAYYEKDGEQYKVVPPAAGAVVENLPEGGEEVKIGDQTYVKIGETYYQPVQVDGKLKYEVAQVEEAAK